MIRKQNYKIANGMSLNVFEWEVFDGALLCLELPCLVQGYSRSAFHTCSMWRADSVHVMELLSDSI